MMPSKHENTKNQIMFAKKQEEILISEDLFYLLWKII